MTRTLSPRLREIVDALPLRDGLRVLEIGCGSGAMAREMARRIDGGYVLGIDCSEKAIGQAIRGSQAEITQGRLGFRTVAIEHFELEPEEPPFDLAVAIRVGGLDGRHPEIETAARARIRAALVADGRLFIDEGAPLNELPLA
jgi:cyclopropane fatty-acyl-phospholipid synthase-like methyltransferase